MSLADRRAITDICLLVSDLEASVAFYTGKLGFTVAHRMPGFVDFTGLGVVLALWDAAHIQDSTGVIAEHRRRDHTVMIAVRLESPDELDRAFADLTAAGIEFTSPPADYPWNARCCYFSGPDNELWELYAWHEGGEPGAVSTG